MLNYTLTPHPKANQWHIVLTYDHAGGEHILKLANWVAGSYMIRDFSRHIMHIQAKQNHQEINIIQQDKNTWRLPEDAGQYCIEYTVYANDLSVRASWLDTERGFIDGACLFLYQPNRRDEACMVQFQHLPQAWRIYTTLPSEGKNRFVATDYAHLTDCPFEMGERVEVLAFDAGGISHRIVLSGYYAPFDRERLISDCQKICEYEIALFPKPTPFKEYAFLLYVGDGIYGGLEHTSSTALHADRNSLPPFHMNEANAAYTQLLGLIAHEYFHAWNVKSIKPTKFQPYDLDKEVYTEQLWAYEGITSYYDDLILVRSGVISPDNYLNLLGQNMTRVHRYAGRKRQTLAQSSFAAWHKYYKQDENSLNAITSYYQHGALMAMCLDLLIRTRSDYSLDDVMRHLYQRFVDTGKGTNEGEWQTLAQDFLGVDLSEFFQQALYSTEDLPLASCLASVGLKLHWAADNGTGGVVNDAPSTLPQADVGCRVKQQTDGAILTHVFNHGSAENAALKPNDKVIAVNGFVCTDFVAQTQTQIGQTHLLHFFRQGVLHQTHLTVQAAAPTTAYLQIVDKSALHRWLSGT